MGPGGAREPRVAGPGVRRSFVHTLQGRLFLFGAVPTFLVLAAIVALSASDNYLALRESEERVLTQSAEGGATELSLRNGGWDGVTATMALAQANGLFGARKASSEYAKAVAEAFPLTIGAYVVYEPNADGQDAASLGGTDLPKEAMDPSGRFVPYWYVPAGLPAGVRRLELKPNADMETLEYYLGPKTGFQKTGNAAPTLTEPYLYEGVLMVSHTYPIVRDGKFVGITGVDRSLDLLSSLVADIKARRHADVFVVSAGGRFIAATTDQAPGLPAADRLSMKEIAGSPYGLLADRLRSASKTGTTFVANDPILREPCIYATAAATVGGWIVVVRRTEADVMAAARSALRRNVLVGLLGLAVVGGILWFIGRSVSRRVAGAVDIADRIARGDLTQTIPEVADRDEAGNLIRSMTSMDGSLNALVGSVHQATGRLDATAVEIASTCSAQEASAATVGAATSQVAAAVHEISATGKELVRTMASVSDNAAQTADLAGAGRAGLAGMETVMRDLDAATTSVAERLAGIHERSTQITDVISTITTVADRTNILSINAAVEAEKAGESGAGFRVVSREIRRLADDTAAATLDIEKIVRQMQDAVASGVTEVKRFADQVRRGGGVVASAGSQLAEIIDRVNRSSESLERVNEAVRAQSQGALQISEAMTSLSGNASQSVRSAKDLGRVSDELRASITEMREAVSRFKLKG